MKSSETRNRRNPLFTRLRNRQRELTRHGNDWLRRYPRVHRVLDATGCLKGGAEFMARGVAVGLFVGLTPTVGFQTLLMIVGCMIARGNFLAAFVVSWVSNPFTMGPLYWGFHILGETLLRALPLSVDSSPAWFMKGPGEPMVFTITGSLLIAVPAAAAGYLVSQRISAAIAARRRQRGRRSVAS